MSSAGNEMSRLRQIAKFSPKCNDNMNILSSESMDHLIHIRDIRTEVKISCTYF